MAVASTSTGPISLLDCVIYLRMAARDRDAVERQWEDEQYQSYVDRTLLGVLQTLKGVPCQRWLDLWNNVDLEPVALAAATHCADPDIRQIVKLGKCGDLTVPPLSPIASMLGFAKFGASANEASNIHLADLIELGQNVPGVSILLSMLSRAPTLDFKAGGLEAIPAEIGSMLSWYFARDGFDEAESALLFKWCRRNDEKKLVFWAAAALCIRLPSHHPYSAKLALWAEGDPHRLAVSEAIVGAVTDGPLTPGEAEREYRRLNDGPRHIRLRRAIRFAAFLPVRAPIVDPYAMVERRERLALALGDKVREAISSGLEFRPNAYIQKEQERRARDGELNRIRSRLPERMQARSWLQAMIQEALRSPVTYPVTGYGKGDALRYVHPKTGCSVVVDATTNEVLHVGRKEYRYRLPPGHELSKPDNLPHSFKGDPDWSSFPRREEQATILVKLRDEMVDVWRPVRANRMNKNIYGIVGQDIPRDEVWDFFISHFVACEMQDFAEGRFITAVQRVDQGDLYR